MRRHIIIIIAVLASISCKEISEAEKLNRQAAREYLQPVRPGYEGSQPYWNRFASKFTYAPAFDFNEYEGAASYKFTVYLESQYFEFPPNQKQGREDNWYLPKHIPESAPHWSFTAKSPHNALTPIWEELPQGYMDLVVEAVDRKGHALATVGTRRFLRDFPFVAPGEPAGRDYKEAAVLALKYCHNNSLLKYWRDSNEADMSMAINSYVCKIIGSIVQLEAMTAKYIPEYREDALKAAKNAADYLMRSAFPEGSPLPYFPPTYKGRGNEAAKAENQVSTMIMEAIYPAIGYLDLYDQTGDAVYLEEAVHIADTFTSLQQEDGSLPKKVYYETGEQIIGGAMLGKILQFISRLKNQYGIDKFDNFILKGEEWMAENPMKTLDFTPQFEDVAVVGWEPYEDFTNCTSATYVSYLLENGRSWTKEELADCKDILAMCEDQLVYWNSLKTPKGAQGFFTPCVMEQFTFRVPIDDSACNMANGWLDYYNATGDKLALAKCTAMVNALTNVQRPETGSIPTGWIYNKGDGAWTNCITESIKMLLRYHDQFGEIPKTNEASFKPEEFKDYDIYLAIGDRGMAGKGYMAPGDDKAVEGVALLDGEGIPVTAGNPFNRYSSVIEEPGEQMVSPAYSFAMRMHEKTGRRILMVVNAADKPVENGWCKDSTLFKEAVIRAGQAKAYGNLKGIIWFCGNSSESGNAQIYDDFYVFVQDLRDALGEGDIPFIASELPEWYHKSVTTNSSIETTLRRTHYGSSVSAEWLVWRDDEEDGYLDRFSNIRLGKRFADRMLETERYVIISTSREKQ